MRVTGQSLIGQFGEAYVYAVARTAGFQVAPMSADSGHKIDWLITSSGADNTVKDPRLEVQVKTTTASRHSNGCSRFDFDKELYDWARRTQDELYMPRITVLIQAPADPDEWNKQDDDQLIVQHCAYWVSLRDQAPLTNTDQKTVHFPRNQKFDVPGLITLMKEISIGNWP